MTSALDTSLIQENPVHARRRTDRAVLAGLSLLIAPLWACGAGSDASGGAPVDADAAVDADAVVDARPGGDAPVERAGWRVPDCATVRGAPVTFTRDEGLTLASLEQAPTGTTYVTSVIALEAPNTLLAAKDSELFRSVDAGCSWSLVGQVEGDFIRLVPGADRRAYGWSPHLPDLFFVTERGVTHLRGPGADVRGLAARPDAPGELRLVDAKGSVFSSDDEGQTWAWIGAVPDVTEGSVQRVAFGGATLDRIAVSMWGGLFASLDGGRQWTRAEGLSATSANIFSVAISPADEQVVWAQGVDLTAEGGLDGRHMYVSHDGGLHFEVVLTANADITLPNGVPMLPHTTDADILYFTWGTSFQGIGSKLYKVSAQEKSVTFTSNPYHRIEALTASPADGRLIYLGLSNEQIDW